MGSVHYLFGSHRAGSPLAIAMIRRARVELAAYLLPHSNVSPSQCLNKLRVVLGNRRTLQLLLPPSDPKSADDLILEAMAVLSRPTADNTRLEDLLCIFDGPDAQRFASHKLRLPVEFN